MSPQEISKLTKTNVDYVQLYPSDIFIPETFIAFKETNIWGEAKFMLDHCNLDNCEEWLAAGVTVACLDHNMLGEDCVLSPNDSGIVKAERQYKLGIKDFSYQLIDELTEYKKPRKSPKGADVEHETTYTTSNVKFERVKQPPGGTSTFTLG